MASAGLVFMPGMMTGQILGGQSPTAAGLWQIMIYFAISTSSCLTALFLAFVVSVRMFDVRNQSLKPWRFIPGLREANTDQLNTTEMEMNALPRRWSFDFKHTPNSQGIQKPVLMVENLTVETTKLEVPLLLITKGDHVGVRGKTGVGKSQLLRSLARLDRTNDGAVLSLNGVDSSQNVASYRSKVILVSQDRPAISGSPRVFYEQILHFRSIRESVDFDECQQRTPMEIAFHDWGLPRKCGDQQWNELSGGEAQRASLAIALAMEPELLLLDEPTSACDLETTLCIEKTLTKRNVTIVLVSHSQDQLKRMCSSQITMT